MIALEKKYQDKLSSISEEIQNSELLSQYLEEEDEEFYNQLKDEFEPKLNELHEEVAEKDPLQLESLETHLLDLSLEGLFLPRILGYSVLRGTITDNFKYIRPQEHFKGILLAICNSSNFDSLKQRIGQTVEVGFALSSDIWITNLIAEINNKQVKQFLQGFKSPKYRDIRSRHTALVRYNKQFVNFNFLTANKPISAADLKIEFKSISNFLMYRASLGSSSSASVYEFISGILTDASLGGSDEHLQVLTIIGLYFDLKDEEQTLIVKGFDSYINKESEDHYFNALKKMQLSDLGVNDEAYLRLNGLILRSKTIDYKEFLSVVTQINEIGYINSDAIEIARSFYNKNKGLSIQNECLRNMVYAKFSAFMKILSPKDFHDYFELNKTFTVYMNIFANEKFNQQVKGICMRYVKQLLKAFTEKRSKDYQDIKKFVTATFSDLGFLNEKELKELFKTKRKKPVA